MSECGFISEGGEGWFDFNKLMNLYIVNCDVLHVNSELLKIPNLLIIKEGKKTQISLL